MYDPLNEQRAFPILTVVLAMLLAIMTFAMAYVLTEWRELRQGIVNDESALRQMCAGLREE